MLATTDHALARRRYLSSGALLVCLLTTDAGTAVAGSVTARAAIGGVAASEAARDVYSGPDAYGFRAVASGGYMAFFDSSYMAYELNLSTSALYLDDEWIFTPTVDVGLNVVLLGARVGLGFDTHNRRAEGVVVIGGVLPLYFLTDEKSPLAIDYQFRTHFSRALGTSELMIGLTYFFDPDFVD